MTSQRGSRVRIPPSPLKAEAVISLGFSCRRRDHPFSFFSSAESYSSVAPLRRWWSQVLPPQRSAPVPAPPSACPNLHRRTPDIFSVLLRTGKPPPSVFRPAQEDRGRLCSPPTRRETPSKHVLTRTGGLPTPLHSSCSDPISQWTLLQACSTRSGGAGSPPKTSGGPRTTLQPSYAQGNPLQACFGSHRRNVGALALLLCRWKPLPSVFRPAQEDPRHLFSPPTHRTPPSQARRVESRSSRLGFPINEQNGQFCSG